MTLDAKKARGPVRGLSFKLITVIAFVILLVEVAVFFPSLANYRASWLDDRLRIGGVAVRVFDAVPDVMDLPVEITDPLLQSAGALAIVYRRAGQTDLIAIEGAAMPAEAHLADMRDRNPMRLIMDATEALLFGGNRILRIVGVPPGAGDVVVEVLMPDGPLRADMLTYSGNILALSLIIAGVTAIVIYVFAERLLIAPIKRLTANVLAFRNNPENGTLVITPDPDRDDEIAVLEEALAETQAELFTMLRQRRHLADLGLAVAKINHDLRNMLTSAQLLSDQVATLDDPKVQRLAPRLVNTLDRAIDFAQSVLDYGRQQAGLPKPQRVSIRALGFESALAVGLFGHPAIGFDNRVADDLVLNLDPDHLARVLVNLMTNAREALDAMGEKNAEPIVILDAEPDPNRVRLTLADNGPGLPHRARENLFVAFEGSARAGGTGLGLAIARELVTANGGELSLLETPSGTTFALDFPLSARV